MATKRNQTKPLTAVAPATKGKAGWTQLRAATGVDEIIRKPELARYVGLRHSVIADMITKGKFPRPMRLNPDGRAVGWLSSEIAAWQRARAAERDNAAAGENSPSVLAPGDPPIT
jgi:prophage regulatory protein